MEKKIAEHIEIKIESGGLEEKLIKKIFRNEFEHLPDVEADKTPYIRVKEQTKDEEPKFHWNMVTFEKLTIGPYFIYAVFSISKDKCDPDAIKKLDGLLKEQLNSIEAIIKNIGNTKGNLERILDINNIDFSWNDLNKDVRTLREENRNRKKEIEVLEDMVTARLDKIEKVTVPPGIDMVG